MNYCQRFTRVYLTVMAQQQDSAGHEPSYYHFYFLFMHALSKNVKARTFHYHWFKKIETYVIWMGLDVIYVIRAFIIALLSNYSNKLV